MKFMLNLKTNDDKYVDVVITFKHKYRGKLQ